MKAAAILQCQIETVIDFGNLCLCYAGGRTFGSNRGTSHPCRDGRRRQIAPVPAPPRDWPEASIELRQTA